MNTLEFLQRVLPDTGIYVTTVINPDEKPRQRFFTSVERLAKAVIESDTEGDNTYYAISSFKRKGTRKKDNVLFTRLLALDVDCGPTKPYPSATDGVQALSDFVATMALPKPMVVFSGNGLHAYWTLDEALPPEQWQPLADGLKFAAAQHNFRVDPGLTANSALVLRPIGTTNPKNGKTVRLLNEAGPYPVADLSAVLLPAIAGTPTHINGKRFGVSKLAAALAVTTDYPPAVADVVVAKCAQIRWALASPSEVPEPFWYGMMGVAGYCTEPDATAMAWSEGHPQYDPASALAKMKQWVQTTTGPATCGRFEMHNPGGCKDCKFKGKIGTPARLGVQYKEVAADETAPPQAATEVKIPFPFKRTSTGIKMVIDESDIDLCSFDLYPVSYGRDESLGYETVSYLWNRKHMGWQTLVFRQALLTDGHRDFPSTIADQGIVLGNKALTGYFQSMLRSYMESLRQQQAMTNLYTNMGWKENFTQFVIGDTVYRRNPDDSVSEETVSLAQTSTRLGHDLYGTQGTVEEWANFTTVADKTQLHAHMFALCVSLSAPFYEFTGLKGMTISLYGPTGGGKTLAQMWMQSVWGNPSKLHFAAKFTQNALFSRMGLYCNMPVTVDEFTMVSDKDVGDFLYWVSQGRDKARLTRMSEERDTKHFSLPVVVSTNKSLNAKLLASGLDSDAQMARLLEISVTPCPLFTNGSNAGRMMYGFLNDHYGAAGRAYIKKLLELGPDGIRAAIADAVETFKVTYKAKFSGDERYWEQAFVLAHLAGRLATEWGIIKFDYQKGIEDELAQIGAIRRTISENKVDSFDILSEYLNENAATALTAIHTGKHTSIDHTRLPRGDLRIRFDLYRPTSSDTFNAGVVLLDRTHFRRWMALHGFDYKVFMGLLEVENIVATPRSQKASLGKDTPIKLPQTYVLGINLDHPRLQGILGKADQDLENTGFAKLRLV